MIFSTIQKIRIAFEKMSCSYDQVFKTIYPAHGSNGFTERNQTFFFTHNYLKDNLKAICWQEVPFDDGTDIDASQKTNSKKNNHIDALIVDDESILYIEVKRLSSPTKFDSVIADIMRLKDFKIRKQMVEDVITPGRKEYILYLVDIWAETDFKKKMIRNWENRYIEFMFKKLLSSFPLLECIDTKVQSFENYIGMNATTIRKYHIAYALFEIKPENKMAHGSI